MKPKLKMTKQELIATLEALVRAFTAQLQEHPEYQVEIDEYSEMIKQLKATN